MHLRALPGCRSSVAFWASRSKFGIRGPGSRVQGSGCGCKGPRLKVQHGATRVTVRSSQVTVHGSRLCIFAEHHFCRRDPWHQHSSNTKFDASLTPSSAVVCHKFPRSSVDVLMWCARFRRCRIFQRRCLRSWARITTYANPASSPPVIKARVFKPRPSCILRHISTRYPRA
eukprot:2438403-Rhodomonas_salina.1